MSRPPRHKTPQHLTSTLIGGSSGAAPPSIGQTPLPPLWTTALGSVGTNGLILAQDTPIGTGVTDGQTSVTDEPSVSSFGNDVFYTGNFYAGLSTDGGHTFGYVNAYQFPSVFGGFCCDQRTIYIPNWNLTAWALMYSPDSNNNNEVRLAIAQGQSGLESNTWTYWDFTPAEADFGPGLMLDYPQLAYSSNNLYLTANVLFPDGSIDASLVFRCPLSTLSSASIGTLQCANYWLNGADTDTFTPADGATTTMYWANHISPTTLQVFQWPESGDWTTVTSTAVTHSAFVDTNYSCPSPDGTDMCLSDDWTVRGGWVANGMIGFVWDAAGGTGGLGSFPYPYVHVVEIALSTLTLIDEPIIWSSNVAWAYAGVGVNGAGAIATGLTYAGGGNYPGAAVMVRDSGNPATWQVINAQQGTSGPPANRWGDFLTVRAYGGNGLSWVAADYTIQGTCVQNWGPCGAVQPIFLLFGAPGSLPCPVVQPATTRASVLREFNASSPLHSIYLPIVSNNACSTGLS